MLFKFNVCIFTLWWYYFSSLEKTTSKSSKFSNNSGAWQSKTQIQWGILLTLQGWGAKWFDYLPKAKWSIAHFPPKRVRIFFRTRGIGCFFKVDQPPVPVEGCCLAYLPNEFLQPSWAWWPGDSLAAQRRPDCVLMAWQLSHSLTAKPSLNILAKCPL